MSAVTKPPRMSADERRESILEAAVPEFAAQGLHGTSTEDIARRAGVSQPYLFRLFGTKKDLFIATVERGFDRVETVFREASRALQGEDALKAMGDAYVRLLANRDELLLQLHAYAACEDPEVQQVVRTRYLGLMRLVQEVSAADDERVREFFAYGMLINIVAAMNLVPALGEEWARKCFPSHPMQELL